MRAVLVALVAALLVGFSSTTAGAASGCVSRPEYRQLHRHMTLDRAQAVIGSNGKVIDRLDQPGWHSISKEYRACGGGVVWLDLDREGSHPYRIAQKFRVLIPGL